MSLKSLCEAHTATFVSLTETGGAGGGLIQAETEHANCKCRIVELSVDKAAEFQQIGADVDYLVFTVYNPRSKKAGADVRRVKFTDENGDVRVLKVDGPAKNPDRMNRFWRMECKEMTAVEGR